MTHPVMLGILARFAWSIADVRDVGIDTRFNANGVKFQPDITGLDAARQPLFFIDYESPNSSDARVLAKDVDAYCAWRKTSAIASALYLIITTLPDSPSPNWELRYATLKGWNCGFAGRRREICENPFRFWYRHYASGCVSRCLDGVSLLNVSGQRVDVIDLFNV